ncbi:hypothetical protein O6H91_11G024400 [Diphasiastrum complanatum]|uniref:Uncharacterized protein n=1 Tax=Diphasiastrum complanatum TaxID=34168 RepID=A0ACC2C778_DIPCM|nr:hypothetical protein O6H91_11G024400 [Diphasiastrum complanatum]
MTSRRTSTTIPSACLPCILLGLCLLSFMRSFPDFIVTAATPSCSLSKENCRELAALNLNLNISFSNTAKASQDFGHMYHDRPSAIIYPSSAQDIVAIVKLAYFSPNNLTIAAKGAGHSIYGQAQALHGIVIEMSSLKGIEVGVHGFGEAAVPFVEASGGELWIDVVKEALKKGMAPRSLTDYLYLSVGGTLSNAGVSGQAFRYGPQISNVLELEVVTGKGEIVICSKHQHADLFYSVLGGLGQFAIITKAKIRLHHVPPKVKWVRAYYSDFSAFTKDQEMLISQGRENSFDYIEGSVLVKGKDVNSWKMESHTLEDVNSNVTIESDAPVLYCLELTKAYFERESNLIGKKLNSLLERLHYLPSKVSIIDASYLGFLDRVHDKERDLRKSGLWYTPHPWLNLFIPKSRIIEFDAWVFKKKLSGGINGPMLVYPLNRNKWDSRMSAVTPSEDIFYSVGLLGYASPRSAPTAESLMDQNSKILYFCRTKSIEYKQYLPHYVNQDEWRTHFDRLWPRFRERKLRYDPKAILSPGQRFFWRSKTLS